MSLRRRSCQPGPPRDHRVELPNGRHFAFAMPQYQHGKAEWSSEEGKVFKGIKVIKVVEVIEGAKEESQEDNKKQPREGCYLCTFFHDREYLSPSIHHLKIMFPTLYRLKHNPHWLE